MSTHASITAKLDDKFYSIYLHSDGYPAHAFAILARHYATEDAVRKLIDLGDLSILAPSPDCPVGHTFESRIPGYCVAYGRDRNEAGTEAAVGTTAAAARRNGPGKLEYNYLFADGEWTISSR